MIPPSCLDLNLSRKEAGIEFWKTITQSEESISEGQDRLNNLYLMFDHFLNENVLIQQEKNPKRILDGQVFRLLELINEAGSSEWGRLGQLVLFGSITKFMYQHNIEFSPKERLQMVASGTAYSLSKIEIDVKNKTPWPGLMQLENMLKALEISGVEGMVGKWFEENQVGSRSTFETQTSYVPLSYALILLTPTSLIKAEEVFLNITKTHALDMENQIEAKSWLWNYWRLVFPRMPEVVEKWPWKMASLDWDLMEQTQKHRINGQNEFGFFKQAIEVFQSRTDLEKTLPSSIQTPKHLRI